MGVFSGCEGPAGKPGIEGLDGDDGANGAKGEKGAKGDDGDQGDKGDKGASGKTGEPGEPGDKGIKGPDGTSVYITDVLEDEGDLPVVPNEITDAYLIDGDLWVWDLDPDEPKWVNLGKIAGPEGDRGPDGNPGNNGTGHLGVKEITVTYDAGDLSAGSHQVYDENLLSGSYARRPTDANIIKRLIDYPVQGLYKTTDINSLRYTVEWEYTVNSVTSVWDFADPVTDSVAEEIEVTDEEGNPITVLKLALTAKWTAPSPLSLAFEADEPGESSNFFNAALAYINTTGAVYEGAHVILLDSDAVATATKVINAANIRNLTIIGIEENIGVKDRTISLNDAVKGYLFNVTGANKSLTIRNIILTGVEENNQPLVTVANTAAFTMDNSKITGNTNTSIGANITAGVFVNNAAFTMNDSSITGVTTKIPDTGTAASAMAVYVYGGASASFTMNGGTIGGGSTSENRNMNVVDDPGTAATLWDVFIDANTAAYAFTVKGDSRINSVTLSANSAAPNNAKITLDGWEGFITTLNLRGDMTRSQVEEYWYKVATASAPLIVQNATGGALTTPDDFDRFINLGRFIATNLGAANVSNIAPLSFVTTGANAGKLKE